MHIATHMYIVHVHVQMPNFEITIITLRTVYT